MGLVLEWAHQYGMSVTHIDHPARTIKVRAPLKAFARACHTSFATFQSSITDTYLSHTGLIHVPANLSQIVTDVIGFNNSRLVIRHAAGHGAGAHVHPREVARAYQFPRAIDLRGHTIGLIEIGGGLDVKDVATFCRRAGFPVPKITIVCIDEQRNEPASAELVRKGVAALRPGSAGASAIPDAFWATVEASMDTELVAAFARGANIVVYFAAETPRGKFDGISAAMTDGVNQPSVISCSWGVFECQAPRHVMRSMDQVIGLATLRGMTLCASSGDFGDGALNCGKVSAHFPASSPHVLACGGTHLPRSGNREQEVVWSEQLGPVKMSSGGGFSNVFRRPWWQKLPKFRQRGRGVPDVAAKADVAEGYAIVVRGVEMPMGGTSAVAPLWASLVALAGQRMGCPVGLANPALYSRTFARATRRIVEGSNGAFHAGPGWNPCTGLGSPNARTLLDTLTRLGRQRRRRPTVRST